MIHLATNMVDAGGLRVTTLVNQPATTALCWPLVAFNFGMRCV